VFHVIVEFMLVPCVALAVSAKGFSVSAPSVWNSLLTVSRLSAQLASSFRRSVQKTEMFRHRRHWTLLISLRHHAPPIRLRHIGAMEISLIDRQLRVLKLRPVIVDVYC